MLLYAWLSEPDARRAELHFNRYFQAAFPAICRFIRSMRTDLATAQDIAQQALIKLFTHLGVERRAADERVRRAVAELRPLDFGALHVRRVESWRRELGAFHDAAIGFQLAPGAHDTFGTWRDLREEINGRIPPLIRQAVQFMREVWNQIEPKLAGLASFEWLTSTRPTSGTSERQLPAQEPPLVDTQEAGDRRVETCVARFLQATRTRDWPPIEEELVGTGVAAFLTHTSTVRSGLPSLAVPSNGLLYTIAKRQLLDRLRARRPEYIERLEQLVDGDDEGVLGELALEDWSPRESEREVSPSTTTEQAAEGQEPELLEARYQEFLQFLRAPLTRAEGAQAAASGRNRVKAEEARVASLRAKYDRLMAVLMALRESPQPSEEEIARREGLTRNQVKYVVERIREEFNYFFPDLARETQGRRKRQGSET